MSMSIYIITIHNNGIEDMKDNNHNLLKAPSIYKPFKYPWCYEAWKLQQQIHWLADEIPLMEDVRDWQRNLNESEKNLLTHIFRFFTQADVDVGGAYMNHYLPLFKPTEVKMMLSAFASTETIHIDAYSYLLDTVGMPETTYSAFLDYQEMKEKHEHLQSFNPNSLEDIAVMLAVFGGFVEGMALFSSFAILLNFPRFNRMKGMGQVVTWSARDETLHTDSMIKLFQTFVKENPSLWNKDLRSRIYRECATIVSHEDKFINLAFELGGVKGLTAKEVKTYIRYIADRRLRQLGLKPMFTANIRPDVHATSMIALYAPDVERALALENIKHDNKNPLPWLDEMLNGVEHANFFEQRATEYSKACTKGTWDQAFAEWDTENT